MPSTAERAQIKTKLALSAQIGDAVAEKYSSKGAFAQAMGVSAGLVARWLSGSHNFTVDMLVQLEQKLDIRLVSRGEYGENSLA